MKTKFRTMVGLAGGTVGALMIIFTPDAQATVALSELPDLSALIPYATFGNQYADSAVTINGDVGISAGGTVKVDAPSTIDGNLYLATGATKTGIGPVTGTTYYNQDLSAAQAQVFTASSDLHNLGADLSLGDVTVPSTGVTWGSVNGVADVYVVSVNKLTTGGPNVTFAGDPGDYFVLNIQTDLAMTGSAAIQGGADGHILINFWNSAVTSLGTVAHVGNLINGTVLVPYASATFHSTSGAIYSGYSTITLMSDSTVNHVPFDTPVPEPTTLFSGLGALLITLGTAFHFRRSG